MKKPLKLLKECLCGSMILSAGIVMANEPKARLETVGNATILHFNAKINDDGTRKNLEIRALVIPKKQFQVDYNIDKEFPELNKNSKINHLTWKKSEKFKPKTSERIVGVFSTADGNYGYIEKTLAIYRIYRKLDEKYEIDYSFNEDIGRIEKVATFIQALDTEIMKTLVENGAFKK